MSRVKLQVLLEGAIVAALCMVLSLVPTNIGSSFTISLGMIPMIIYCLRRGVKAGLFSGLLWGLLHFLTGNVVFLSVVQVLIEYLLAFTFAGFAGLFSSRLQGAVKRKQSKSIIGFVILATVVGGVARFFWHFIAGVVFWGEYALWGMNPWQFSFIMNGGSGLATIVVSIIVILLITKTYPKVLVPESKKATLN